MRGQSVIEAMRNVLDQHKLDKARVLLAGLFEHNGWRAKRVTVTVKDGFDRKTLHIQIFCSLNELVGIWIKIPFEF
jgi:hypothetical protein